jgi:DNA-binding response OmpR family regulator
MKKKRILIVEDDPGVQDVFKIILEKAGFEAIVYSDGSDIIENKFEHPDLILLDKQLSGIDGLDICRHLKGQETTKHIPVIMTSATTNVGRLAKLVNADDFIEKPFKGKELVAILNKHLH